MTVLYLSLAEAGKKEGSVLIECFFFLVKEDRASRISLDNDSFFSLLSLSSSSYCSSEIFTNGRTVLSGSFFAELDESFLGTRTSLMAMLMKV